MSLQQSKLTTAEIRNKWAIALESGFFKPTLKYLRVLSLGANYEYQHSVMGVLCAVSKLGEFLPEPTHNDRDEQKQSIRHIFTMFNNRYLPPANAKYKEYNFTHPPAELLYHLKIVRYRWQVENIATTPLFQVSSIPENILEEIKHVVHDRYYHLSINDIMTNVTLPSHRKFPIIGSLLRIIEPSFARK
jgi:hypothetical protein